MLHLPLSQASRYPLGPAWELALAFLRGLREDSPEGRQELEGMYALVMSYDCVPAERAILESHRVHADVQMTIAGAERIEVFPSSEQEVKDAYLAERDVTFYRRGRQPAAVAEQRPGWVCLLLPEDAHSPQLAIPGERAWVKKAVVKVPVSELGWAARG